MSARVLADTGALLAFVDASDDWHAPCRAAFSSVRLPLLTTEAVLTEWFHLARQRYVSVGSVWQTLRSGAIEVAPVLTPELSALETLIVRYADRPMDFADATLVHVAERERIQTILTIDHADFETYRIGRRKPFRILPARDATR